MEEGSRFYYSRLSLSNPDARLARGLASDPADDLLLRLLPKPTRWHFDGNMAISQIIKFYEQSPTRGIGASSEKSLSLPADMKSRYTTLKSAPPIELASSASTAAAA